MKLEIEPRLYYDARSTNHQEMKYVVFLIFQHGYASVTYQLITNTH